jgi:hypothetical protein
LIRSSLTETFFIKVDPADPRITENSPRLTNSQLFFKYPQLRKPQYRNLDRVAKRYVLERVLAESVDKEETVEAQAIAGQLIDYPLSMRSYLSGMLLLWQQIAGITEFQWDLLRRPPIQSALVQGEVEISQILNLSRSGQRKLDNPVLVRQMNEGALTVKRVILMSKNELNRILEQEEVKLRLSLGARNIPSLG